MNPLILSGIFELGKGLIDRFFPDPEKKAAAQLELLKMQQSGELAELAANTDLAKGQLDVNKVEAASQNMFVSGWRPCIGWICGISLAFTFVARPLLVGFGVDVPALDMGDLLTILVGMLGLGGMRTYEKQKGVA